MRPDFKPGSVTKLANQPCPAAPPGGLSVRAAWEENGNGSRVVRVLSSSAAKCSLPVLSAGHSGGGGAAVV